MTPGGEHAGKCPWCGCTYCIGPSCPGRQGHGPVERLDAAQLPDRDRRLLDDTATHMRLDACDRLLDDVLSGIVLLEGCLS